MTSAVATNPSSFPHNNHSHVNSKSTSNNNNNNNSSSNNSNSNNNNVSRSMPTNAWSRSHMRSIRRLNTSPDDHRSSSDYLYNHQTTTPKKNASNLLNRSNHSTHSHLNTNNTNTNTKNNNDYHHHHPLETFQTRSNTEESNFVKSHHPPPPPIIQSMQDQHFKIREEKPVGKRDKIIHQYFGQQVQEVEVDSNNNNNSNNNNSSSSSNNVVKDDGMDSFSNPVVSSSNSLPLQQKSTTNSLSTQEGTTQAPNSSVSPGGGGQAKKSVTARRARDMRGNTPKSRGSKTKDYTVPFLSQDNNNNNSEDRKRRQTQPQKQKQQQKQQPASTRSSELEAKEKKKKIKQQIKTRKKESSEEVPTKMENQNQTQDVQNTMDIHTSNKDKGSLKSKSESKSKSNSNSKPTKSNLRFDRFGFAIPNDDNHQYKKSSFIPNPALMKQSSSRRRMMMLSKRTTTNSSQKNNIEKRRIQKWKKMLSDWEFDNLTKSASTKLKQRVRKGIPNELRGKAWVQMAQIQNKIKNEKEGDYKQLLKVADKQIGSSFLANTWDHLDQQSNNDNDNDNEDDGNDNLKQRNNSREQHSGVSESGEVFKDTIERDIHRTFPTHRLFLNQEVEDEFIKEEKEAEQMKVKTTQEETKEVEYDEGATERTGNTSRKKKEQQQKKLKQQELLQTSKSKTTPKQEPLEDKSPDLLKSTGGQASLRRILRAYSVIDPEVGYCQGMNFITAMFIVFLKEEEEAFWLLESVMDESPTRMRGLFGNGMAQAQEVLYIADKLIFHFLPKLANHFENQNVHITMYATQWLLTMYTSSFSFDLVTRVWDCFLFEGWKIAYRVTLAILTIYETELLSMSFENILGFLKELPKHVDGELVMQTAFTIPLRTKHITKYRLEYVTKGGGVSSHGSRRRNRNVTN